ncbi:late embryogenesis abundant protein 29-like [Canna indica]|uniref:Late embryogenesis abundant protein 29-like n=1 Tax=Canna indica TaxID=4628 RepID=A0AAQ3L0R9_9LILI|nr:late embryogenesis abundant protein 29-like [Canna indica]
MDRVGQAAGQAQVKKDEMVNKAYESCEQGQQQAGSFMQQTGDQMRNMAQGAADTVKNATGMEGGDASSTTNK